ncbi:MAG: 5'-nucleotidase C-terminal domain-containing protein, partial [Bacteroidales bacterium]|nr:5'-nucleotidase C-terminal domain-containing protein [Bacteroidales bacterium]
KLYGFVLDQMMDYATSRLTMSAKSARAKKAAEAAKAAGAADDLLVKADLAIVCFRSPQACIPAGDVTPADIMDLLPLDNQTVVLHLEGRCVRELLRHASHLGAVSSLEAGAGAVRAGAGAAAAFDDDRVYKVVTIDHLLKGEFGAQVMKQAQKLDNYNMPLCNTLIQNIKKLTQRGETIK